MSELRERIVVECPYNLAKAFLRDEIAAAKDAARPVRLSVPLASTTLGKDVEIRYDLSADPMHFDEPWRVAWSPAGGGPFPSFQGLLTVRADESYRRSALELEGNYEPPLGTAGLAFDAVAGKRIARISTQRLLEELRARLETRYREQEAQKK